MYYLPQSCRIVIDLWIICLPSNSGEHKSLLHYELTGYGRLLMRPGTEKRRTREERT